MSVLAVIPARYGSTRLEGKPLAEIAGRPMIYHVYRRVRSAWSIEQVIVATDDERIRQAVEAFGGRAVLTSPDHPSGTDRVAEVARLLPYDIVVNVQADEPLVRPAMLDQLVEAMQADPTCPMATLACVLDDLDELDDPNVVKVVVRPDGYALYFSRSPIPFPMHANPMHARTVREIVSYRNDLIHQFYKHIGIYAYRRDFLIQFTQWPPTPLEQTERLEQLRAVEHGVPIRVVLTPYSTIGVDTPADLERVRRLFETLPDEEAR